MDKCHNEQLWESFQKGNHSAFEEIYTDHISDLFNYGKRLTEDHDLIKDAIHDLYIDLWKSKENLSSVSSIKYYLLKSLRRNIFKKVVRNKNNSLEFTPAMEHVIEFELSYEMVLIEEEDDQERVMHLKREINSLTSKQKEVLFLKFYSNMSNQEISEILEINPQSVYNNIYRALEALRGKLNYVLWLGLQQFFYEARI